MIKDIPPSRDDKIYTEIEKFEDYEFRNNIVFEMIIRTPEMKELKKKLTDYLNECFSHLTLSDFEKSKHNYLKNQAEKLNAEKSIDENYINEYPNIQFIDVLLKSFIHTFLSNYEDYIKKSLDSYGLNFDELITYYDLLYLYAKKYNIPKEDIQDYKFNTYPKMGKIQLSHLIDVDNEKTDSILFELIKEENTNISNPTNQVIVKYSRPTLNLQSSQYIDVKINTKFEQKEINDLLLKIEQSLTSKKIVPYSLSYYLDETNEFKIKKIGNKQIKNEYADLLFLYDYLIFNKSLNIPYENSFVDIELNNLLGEKELKYDSLKKKKSTIFNLIEKKEFRNLI